MGKIKLHDIQFPKVTRRRMGFCFLTVSGMMMTNRLSDIGLGSPVSLVEAEHYSCVDEMEKKNEN
jgi:hypothetical protein